MSAPEPMAPTPPPTAGGKGRPKKSSREEGSEGFREAAGSEEGCSGSRCEKCKDLGRGLPTEAGGPPGMDAVPPSEALSQEEFRAVLNDIELGLILGSNGKGEGKVAQQKSSKLLRSLLGTNREELVQEVLNRNWVPMLTCWLRLNDQPSLQLEALWALTNIAAGATADHAHALVKHGTVPILVELLSSSTEEVQEQAMWLLGSLAGEGSAARDAILASGVLPPLVRCIRRPGVAAGALRIGSWAMANLCDGQPPPSLDVPLALEALDELLLSDDTEVLSHACWALSHLCDGSSAHIRAVAEGQVCKRLVELLMHKSWRIAKPSLRTIGNIVCTEDDNDYTQHIIDAGAMPCLRQLIVHSNRDIRKEACWTLSNIAAGSVDQIATVLDSGVMPFLISLAHAPGTDAEVKSEACWVVLNATSCGSDEQIEYLVKEGCVAVLGELLNESSMATMALEGLERILQVGELAALRLDRANGGKGQGNSKGDVGNVYARLLPPSKIEKLEGNKSHTIAKRAQRIRKQYYVSCAICSKSYSRGSPETSFCGECKCHVCNNCNCSKFHLSFQEELWKNVDETDRKKQEEKRLKKQKKKAKAKEKKAQIAQACTDADDELVADASSEPEQQASRTDGEPVSSPEVHSPSQDGMSSLEMNADFAFKDMGGCNTNDDLVSFLEQTGSILALAEMLDQQSVDDFYS